jgi:hypothetical protein
MPPATTIRLLNGELELGRFIPTPTRISPTKIDIKPVKKKELGRKSTKRLPRILN